MIKHQANHILYLTLGLFWQTYLFETSIPGGKRWSISVQEQRALTPLRLEPSSATPLSISSWADGSNSRILSPRRISVTSQAPPALPQIWDVWAFTKICFLFYSSKVLPKFNLIIIKRNCLSSIIDVFR